MTGPEHYRAAESLLDLADVEPEASALTSFYVDAAQAHATLALAAATALPAVKRYYGDDSNDDRAWSAVIS